MKICKFNKNFLFFLHYYSYNNFNILNKYKSFENIQLDILINYNNNYRYFFFL